MQRVFHESHQGGHGYGHGGDRAGDHDGDLTYNRLFINVLSVNYRLSDYLLWLICFASMNFATSLVCLYSPRRLKTSI